MTTETLILILVSISTTVLMLAIPWSFKVHGAIAELTTNRTNDSSDLSDLKAKQRKQGEKIGAIDRRVFEIEIHRTGNNPAPN